MLTFEKGGFLEKQRYSFEDLVEIMKQLRGPNGCLWDKEQTKEKLKLYVLEEAYEVIEAIEEDSAEKLKEELGDLLFQIVFLAQLSSEEGKFDMDEVLQHVSRKMIRRHPHVFKGEHVENTKQILQNWSRIKEEERAGNGSALDGVPKKLPSLLRAVRIGQKASQVGFDWQNPMEILEKVEEEKEELRKAIEAESQEKIRKELGDALFALANLGRFLEINPEDSLNDTIERFIRRFRYIENKINQKGKDIRNASLHEMEPLWEEAKQKGL